LPAQVTEGQGREEILAFIAEWIRLRPVVRKSLATVVMASVAEGQRLAKQAAARPKTSSVQRFTDPNSFGSRQASADGGASGSSKEKAAKRRAASAQEAATALDLKKAIQQKAMARTAELLAQSSAKNAASPAPETAAAETAASVFAAAPASAKATPEIQTPSPDVAASACRYCQKPLPELPLLASKRPKAAAVEPQQPQQRFCSHECWENFNVLTGGGNMVRRRLLEMEHGICQHCGLDAQKLYDTVREAERGESPG
jgi:hypothetical protein